MYHCTNDVWTWVKATFRLDWSHDITSVAHEAIQYCIPPRLQREPGKSPRLRAVGLEGLCNVARGLGGATSQQQNPPFTLISLDSHKWTAGSEPQLAHIRPLCQSVHMLAPSSTTEKKKVRKKKQKGRSVKCKHLQREEVCRIYTVNARQTNEVKVYLIWWVHVILYAATMQLKVFMFPKNDVAHLAHYEAHLQKVELTLIRCASLSLWTFLNSLVGRRKRPSTCFTSVLNPACGWKKKSMCPSATTFAYEGKVNLQMQKHCGETQTWCNRGCAWVHMR